MIAVAYSAYSLNAVRQHLSPAIKRTANAWSINTRVRCELSENVDLAGLLLTAGQRHDISFAKTP